MNLQDALSLTLTLFSSILLTTSCGNEFGNGDPGTAKQPNTVHHRNRDSHSSPANELDRESQVPSSYEKVEYYF
ncbi:MAG: hypothetical protein AAFP88_02990, partial [Bacteroidota bacterium]